MNGALGALTYRWMEWSVLSAEVEHEVTVSNILMCVCICVCWHQEQALTQQNKSGEKKMFIIIIFFIIVTLHFYWNY